MESARITRAFTFTKISPPMDHFDYFQSSEQKDDSETPWESALIMGAMTSKELSRLQIIQRQKVIDTWCFEGDLGFIFAARGIGKTWLGMYMAKSLATYQNVGPWLIHAENTVLYLDGEMPPSDVKLRDSALGKATEKLIYVNHEILFERTGQIMNLANTQMQQAVIELCQQRMVNVLLLDNLSTLAAGIDENNAVDWELIFPWLMRLRRNHITVIFIHHAGRNNELRGHSKREDPSAWIIRLDAPNDANDELEGAHFISRFTKWRNASKQPKTYEWVFSPQANGETLVRVELTSPIDVFRHLIELGLNTCTLIAQEMGVTYGYVSQLAARALKEGWLEIQKRKYIIRDDTHRAFSASADP
jgi:AAA domain